MRVYLSGSNLEADFSLETSVSVYGKVNTFRKRVKNVVTSKGNQVGVESK
jgi:hypothetical protein